MTSNFLDLRIVVGGYEYVQEAEQLRDTANWEYEDHGYGYHDPYEPTDPWGCIGGTLRRATTT